MEKITATNEFDARILHCRIHEKRGSRRLIIQAVRKFFGHVVESSIKYALECGDGDGA